jgi:hypothetical protein
MHYCAIIITESKSINKSAEAAERGRMMKKITATYDVNVIEDDEEVYNMGNIK